MSGRLFTAHTATVTPTTSTAPTDVARSQMGAGFLVILLPLLILGAIGYSRQRQAIARQRQIQRLHRIWQLDSSHNRA